MIKNHALAYAQRGWSVLALYGVEGGICQCGNPNCKSPGKHPVAHNGVKSATRDKRGINLTFKPGNNVGIATGAPSGIWVLDIDGSAGEASLLALQEKHGELPATLEHRTGRGRHLIFDLGGEKIKNSVKRLGDGLDVRGDGGYIVAAPSLHVSGTAYRMGQGEPVEAPDWLLDLVRRQEPKPIEPRPMVDREVTGDQIEDMLSYIHPDIDYQSWLEIGMALHAEGYPCAVWENWSRSGQKFEAGDCEKRWRGFSKSAGITLGSLWYHAEMAGWSPEFLDAAPDTSAADAFVESLTATAKPVAIKKDKFPIDPLALPGTIGDTVRWIVRSSIRPQPEIALMNTLAALGAIFGRRYATEWDTRCNVFVAAIAGTGAGKDHSRKQIKKLMVQAGLSDFLAGDSIVSGPGLLRGLSGQPAQILHLDEFGMLLKSITDEKAPAHLRQVAKALTEIYTSSSSVFHGGHYASPDVSPIIIDKPALSIFGTSTLSVYSDALTSSAIGSGELNRFLVVPADDDMPKLSRNVELPDPPVNLVRHWNQFFDAPGNEQGNLVELAGGSLAAPTPQIVRWDGVLKRLYNIGDMADDRAREASRAGQTGVWTRYREQVIKLSMITAIAKNPIAPEIEHDDLDMAEAIVTYACEFVVQLADNHISDSKAEKDVKYVLGYLRRAGDWVAKSQMAADLRQLPARQRNEILNDLVTVQETVEMRVDKNESRGRPMIYYRLAC